MTTTQIAALANAGNLAAPGTDLQLMLRGEVIPGFMMDVGYTAWRRLTHTAEMLEDDYILQLPIHMSEVREVYVADADGKYTLDPVEYVGDQEKMRTQFQTATADIPTQFYLQAGLGDQVLGANPGWVIVFNCPFSSDRNVRVIGYLGSITNDDYTNDYELDNFIPRHIQPAIIVGLRRRIYASVFGTGDRRYQIEDAEYNRWIARLAESREGTPSRRVVYAR